MKKKAKENFKIGLFVLLTLVVALVFYLKKTTSIPNPQVPEQPVEKKFLPNSVEKNANISLFDKSKKIVREDLISSIRSQLKMNLASLFAAEMSFKDEYGRYSTDLLSIGWSPEREKMDYKMGFLVEHLPAEPAVMDGQQEDSTRMNTDIFVNQLLNESKTPATYTALASSINLDDYHRFCEKNCTADKNSFEMIIVAKFENDQEDVWIINQDKNIINVKDGITGKELTKPYNRK